MLKKLLDRLFAKMARDRNVVPVNRVALHNALQATDNNLRFLQVSGDLSNGNTPSALKRHAVRKLTYNSAVALQNLVQGVRDGGGYK